MIHVFIGPNIVNVSERNVVIVLIKWTKKTTTLSEQFQNQILKS